MTALRVEGPAFPPLVKLLASRLKPGGYLHCATEWEEYAHQMVEVRA